ncbi:MAG: M55 family metallopeptidase, partial [Candidatus Edwardsbacteria bacterium]|nr:M55 family metallopeptidase [Candidatus Edwardsbacteria bacterium]
MKSQLFIFCDMEGASGITDENRSALVHGSEQWRQFGRDCITSDLKAVCDAAIEHGIEDILVYDGHYAGDDEPNVKPDQLPQRVRLVDVPHRCIYWRRIRGQIDTEPFGMVFVGQHARYGAVNAYFAHTIQPRFRELT